MAHGRPGTVTLVAVLTWLAAALDLIVGTYLVWLAYRPEELDAGVDADSLLVYGVVTLVVGVLTAAVAAGLTMGSQAARVLVMAVMIARIAGATYGLGRIGGGFAWQAGIEILVALLVLGLLSTTRASLWFRGRHA